jgi:hypothetical protein
VSDLTYPDCLRELYESEIFGEAVFLALVTLAKNPREQYQLGTLLQLETETKARLRPFLYAHGLSLDETMDLASGIELAVAGYQGLSWAEFGAANIPIVGQYISRFEAIRDAGPTEDRDVLESMVRHESSILTWATLESQGVTVGTLDDVIAQLQYPLPVPTEA